MSAFWKNWLTLWCIAAGLFGVVIYLAGFAATTWAIEPVMRLLGNPWPAQPDRYLHFAFGLMGAVTIGWMLTFHTLFRAAWSLDSAAARPLWRGALLSIAVWYLIDSYVSVMTGFPLNAVSNTVLALGLGYPVWRQTVLAGS